VVYPLLIGLVAARRPKRVSRSESYRPKTTVLLAAFNEERTIRRRVEEFAGLMSRSGIDGEILVVSDGSSDRTVEIVAGLVREAGPEGPAVRLLPLPENQGKAVALTEGGKAAQGDIIVLADARQTWAEDALPKLLENFADPAVGAVSGELMLESAPGVLAGVGLYWKFEKWLRQRESRVHSMVGVTGAICAVRRAYFPPIPQGTILDDVYWPLVVALQGHRVVFDERAHAFDRLPEQIHDELRRKIRTLSGNFQLATRLPTSLLPWKNPIWIPFVSHKLARLVVPWALLAAPLLCLAIGGGLYYALFILQTLGYAVALAGLVPAIGHRSRLASAGASFLVLNLAAWLAFWVWITGRSSRSWHKARYQPADLSTPSEGVL
jgi:cellulose synthase/poly-beta-1,6-N-acetylglucosamine synthase-like glycosyltransferase